MPKGYPDYQIPTRIEAQDISDLDVDVVAQSIADLAVDIAAQSLANLDININKQTLSEVAIDIASQTIGNLGVDVAAQSVGNLAVDIAGQTLSEVGISIDAQTLTNLDMNINAQSIGLSDAAQYAAEQGSYELANTSVVVSAGSTETRTLYTNNLGQDVVLELAWMVSHATYSPDTYVRFEIDVDGDGTAELFPRASPHTGNLSFEPGVKIVNGGAVNILLVNESSNQTTLAPHVMVRVP